MFSLLNSCPQAFTQAIYNFTTPGVQHKRCGTRKAAKEGNTPLP